jgi:hypothetical protein
MEDSIKIDRRKTHFVDERLMEVVQDHVKFGAGGGGFGISGVDLCILLSEN